MACIGICVCSQVLILLPSRSCQQHTAHRLLACWRHAIIYGMPALGAHSNLCTASAAGYAERKLFAGRSLDDPQDRVSKWRQLSWRHSKLEARILAANPSWQADILPAK